MRSGLLVATTDDRFGMADTQHFSWDNPIKAEFKVWAEHLLPSCGEGIFRREQLGSGQEQKRQVSCLRERRERKPKELSRDLGECSGLIITSDRASINFMHFPHGRFVRYCGVAQVRPMR